MNLAEIKCNKLIPTYTQRISDAWALNLWLRCAALKKLLVSLSFSRVRGRDKDSPRYIFISLISRLSLNWAK